MTFPPRVKPVHASRESQRGRTSQDDSSISGVAWLHRNSTAAGGRTSIDLHAYENMLRSVTKQDGDGAESRDQSRLLQFQARRTQEKTER